MASLCCRPALRWVGIYGVEQGQTWLIIGIPAVFWRFEGEDGV